MKTPDNGRKRKRALALILSLALGFLACEWGARSRVGTPLSERLPLLKVRANPMRGWEMVPGVHYTYHHPVQVNSLGLRGPELEPRRPSEVRVLFLGDSLVYGQGVGDEETLPVALENALRSQAPDTHWTVLNAGNRAYGTGQEIGMLEELGARLQPDVVLLGWYWNDVSERAIETTYESFLPRGEFEFDVGGHLDGLVRLGWHARQVPRSSALLMLVYDRLFRRDRIYAPEIVEAGMQRLGPFLERFVQLSEGLSARPFMVLVPDAVRLRGGTETQAFDERALALARERDLVTIELLPALEPLVASTGRLPILPFDGHYDPAANQAMGAYLAERLLAMGVSAQVSAHEE